MINLEIDHFAVACESLPQGVEYVEDILGVSFSSQGTHPKMGTHNQLLSLGAQVYLEVISIDPDAAPPAYPRWFDLDAFSGAPRITNWICRTNSLSESIAQTPLDIGQPMSFERGKYCWAMAVPASGKLPFDGAIPALIEWEGSAHPATDLPENGCRFKGFEISHPQSQEVGRHLRSLGLSEPHSTVRTGEPSIRLNVTTPRGARTLT